MASNIYVFSSVIKSLILWLSQKTFAALSSWTSSSVSSFNHIASLKHQELQCTRILLLIKLQQIAKKFSNGLDYQNKWRHNQIKIFYHSQRHNHHPHIQLDGFELEHLECTVIKQIRLILHTTRSIWHHSNVLCWG